MRRVYRDAVGLILGFGVAALGFIIAAELAWPPYDGVDDSTTSARRRAEPLPDVPLPPPVPSLPAYGEIVARSLFVPARRSAAPADQAVAQAVTRAQTRSLTLSGILINGRRRLALLREAGSTADLRLEAGQLLGDWTVVEVHIDGVVLRNGADTLQLHLQP
jgi:hypothetical protein